MGQSGVTAPNGQPVAAAHTVSEKVAPKVAAHALTRPAAIGGIADAADRPVTAAAQEAAVVAKAGPAMTDESVARWVQLPQQRSKGRAAQDTPSAEQPWQVGAVLHCPVLCPALLCHADDTLLGMPCLRFTVSMQASSLPMMTCRC